MIWLIMRLTILILLVTLMHVSASTLAQKVTINLSNSSMKSVFKELKAQTGYNFLYTESQLLKAKPVSIQAKNTELHQVLQHLFADQPLTYELNRRTIVVREKLQPIRVISQGDNDPLGLEIEQQPIRGRVVNEKGEPLAGATVYVLDVEGKRTSKQTITDSEGNFQLLDMPQGIELEVAYLGYTSQKIRAKVELETVTLQPFLADLEEIAVINTGYQKIKANEMTGAVQVLTQKDLQQ